MLLIFKAQMGTRKYAKNPRDILFGSSFLRFGVYTNRWILELVAIRSLELSRYELSSICDNLYRMGGMDHAL
jgi:hypothetical protein